MCGYYGSTTKWAIAFLSLAIGFIGFSGSGAGINNLDIAPKYAGILMGIANTIGTIPGFVGPQVAKFIAKKVSMKMYTLKPLIFYRVISICVTRPIKIGHVGT